MQVLCDVDNPLSGSKGAAQIFGPQKGATPQMVETLDKGLKNLAKLVRENFNIEIELAGVKKEDIDIETENGVLSIKTERKIDETKNYKHSGMYFGEYSWSFNLPDDININTINAELIDGILSIKIPKIIDKAKLKKQIKIK